jgi:glycosyltransferase involved in cell wall biosynthesis
MTLGAIPIAGNNSSQPEIVGDAGFLVQTADSESIFDAMATLLAEPDNCPIRKRLGVEKSSAFSWEASCRKLLEIYSVANTSNKLKCQFPSR